MFKYLGPMIRLIVVIVRTFDELLSLKLCWLNGNYDFYWKIKHYLSLVNNIICLIYQNWLSIVYNPFFDFVCSVNLVMGIDKGKAGFFLILKGQLKMTF